MRIVHYTLGICPQRAGGLNKYATDLMKEQSKKHEVAVITPGSWRPWNSACSIRQNRNIGAVHSYKLQNALPLPLLYGIKRPECFMKKRIEQKSFEQFYTEMHPDVLHLHTLMGLPEDALCFFKDKGVRIVYTSHDYFGICPKVNLINQDGVLCDEVSPERCVMCNAGAPSVLFLRWRNSDVALKMRDCVRWLKNTFSF